MKSNRKALNKLTAVMLILAVCITTVFGGIFSAFAASGDATYTVEVKNTIVPFGDKGTAYLTFDLESGFVKGNFTLLENFVNPRDDEIELAIADLIKAGTLTADYTVADYKAAAATDEKKIAINTRMAQWAYEFESVEVSVSSGTPVVGTFSADDFTVTNEYADEGRTTSPNNTERHKYDRLSNVEFNSDTKAYKSVTFKLEYKYEYHVRVGANDPSLDNGIRLAHAEYSATELDQCSDGGHKKLTYTDPTLIDAEDVEYTATKTQPEGTLDYFHSHRWDWRTKTPTYTNSNGYYVYEAECTVCGMTNYQLGTKNSTQSSTHNYYEISGINVQYEDNGTVSVNVHIPTATQNEELVICKMDGTSTKYGSIEVTSENYNEVLTDSYYAKTPIVDADGNITSYTDNILPGGTMMYTIKGLSATDLKSELMLTRLVDKTYLGASHPFSLQEYALNVITGENVYYPEPTTEAQKAADKEVAAAFVNYAVNASNALDNKISSKPKSVVKWSREYKITTEADFLASLGDSAGNVGTGTEDDPFIISTPEQLFYVACYAGASSAGKYYKVSDFVGEFNMGKYAYEATVDDIKANLNTGWGAHYSNASENPFQGNFDGNGVVIYGLDGRAWQTGLFPKTSGNAAIKNLTVLSSSFISTGSASAGAIVGEAGNIAIENCAVKWCYIEGTGSTTSMGTIIGKMSDNCKAEITNCMVMDNYFNVPDAAAQLYPYGGLIGYCAKGGGNIYRSIISLGNAPYSTVYDDGQLNVNRPNSDNVSNRYSNTFHGVYTDQPESYFCGYYVKDGSKSNISWSPDFEIQQLTREQMTGKDIKATMPHLEWSQWFAVADGYPRLRIFYQTGNEQEDILVWDGTVATGFAGGSGTEADPYIIETPEQLAYLVSGAGSKDGSTTKGNYYKIADGISAFNMYGHKNVNLYSTVENLRGSLTSTGENYNWGRQVGNGDYGRFSGTFDGNGVRIYNLYSSNASSGLFPYVTNGATIKNISVENSYIKATYTGSYGAGGLIGSAQKLYQSEPAALYIENCAVRDCYILNTHIEATSTSITAAHAIGNATWTEPHITNCFFANNYLDVSAAQMSDGTKSATVGGVVGATAKNTISISLSSTVVVSHAEPDKDYVATGLIGGYSNYTFDKCYTTDSTVDILAHSGVTLLTGGYSDILGGNAVVNMPELLWGTMWFAGQPGKYPALYDDGIANLPTEITSLLNAPVLDESGNKLVDGWDDFVANYDSTAVNHSFTTTDPKLNMYSSGLNLKDNPYLLVTFELIGEYKTNKEKVVATFTVGDQTITVKGNEMTNNEGAGRFHLVRLKGIDVKNLCDAIDVKVSYNDTDILTGTLSVAGFVYKANRSGPQYEHYALAGKALIYYSQVLNARATIKGNVA